MAWAISHHWRCAALSLDRATARNEKCYETPVVRLWIDGDLGFEHGDMRYVATHGGLHFRELGRAVHFMDKLAKGDHE